MTHGKKKDLGNARELVDDFEERLGTEVRQQVGERKVEKEKYRRMELPGKYTAKLLYGWDNKKFEEEYLEKLEWNWKRWKEDRQINKNKYLKRIEEREEEEKEKMKERDLSYTSPPVQKQHPCGETTPKSYKPASHSGHLSCNMSYGSAATLQVFCLP